MVSDLDIALAFFSSRRCVIPLGWGSRVKLLG